MSIKENLVKMFNNLTLLGFIDPKIFLQIVKQFDIISEKGIIEILIKKKLATKFKKEKTTKNKQKQKKTNVPKSPFGAFDNNKLQIRGGTKCTTKMLEDMKQKYKQNFNEIWEKFYTIALEKKEKKEEKEKQEKQKGVFGIVTSIFWNNNNNNNNNNYDDDDDDDNDDNGDDDKKKEIILQEIMLNFVKCKDSLIQSEKEELEDFLKSDNNINKKVEEISESFRVGEYSNLFDPVKFEFIEEDERVIFVHNGNTVFLCAMSITTWKNLSNVSEIEYTYGADSGYFDVNILPRCPCTNVLLYKSKTDAVYRRKTLIDLNYFVYPINQDTLQIFSKKVNEIDNEINNENIEQSNKNVEKINNYIDNKYKIENTEAAQRGKAVYFSHSNECIFKSFKAVKEFYEKSIDLINGYIKNKADFVKKLQTKITEYVNAIPDEAKKEATANIELMKETIIQLINFNLYKDTKIIQFIHDVIKNVNSSNFTKDKIIVSIKIFKYLMVKTKGFNTESEEYRTFKNKEYEDKLQSLNRKLLSKYGFIHPMNDICNIMIKNIDKINDEPLKSKVWRSMYDATMKNPKDLKIEYEKVTGGTRRYTYKRRKRSKTNKRFKKNCRTKRKMLKKMR